MDFFISVFIFGRQGGGKSKKPSNMRVLVAAIYPSFGVAVPALRLEPRA
jgi:hypothetical protein